MGRQHETKKGKRKNSTDMKTTDVKGKLSLLEGETSSTERAQKSDTYAAHQPESYSEPNKVLFKDVLFPIERVRSTWIPGAGLDEIREETGKDPTLSRIRSWLMHLNEQPSTQTSHAKPNS